MGVRSRKTLLKDADYADLRDMSTGRLGNKLQGAADILAVVNNALIDTLELQMFILLSVEAVFLLIGELYLTTNVSSALLQGHAHLESFEAFVPESIRPSVPWLHNLVTEASS